MVGRGVVFDLAVMLRMLCRCELDPSAGEFRYFLKEEHRAAGKVRGVLSLLGKSRDMR